VATLSAPLLAALARYQGVALIGPRSNAKTADFAIPLPLPPNLPGLACTVARVESLPPDVPVALERGGAFRLWREKCESPDVIESTTDGWPALIGRGALRYLAGWPDPVALARILTALCAEQGIASETLPEGLRCRDTASHRFWFNYNPAPITWQGLTLPAAGVLWQARKA